MNHEKSIEEREEERLMRAFAGAKPKPIKIGGSSDDHVNVPTLTSPKGAAAPAATHHSTAASSSTTATTTTTEVVSPRKKDEIPLWKQRQLAAEEETRQRLEREAIEKQKAIQHRVQHKEIDDVPTALSPRLNAPDADKHIEQERILVNYMKHNSTAGDLEKAQKAAEAERDRLENIFKAKPTVNKQRFAAVSETAKANMAKADIERDIEEKRVEAAEKAAQELAAQLTRDRVALSAQRLSEANAHYAGANANELHVNELERAVVAEIGLLRADPRAYAAKLQMRREHYENGVLTLRDTKNPHAPALRIKTTDGVAAVDEAISLLHKTKPAPLHLERGLVRAMYNAVRDDKGQCNFCAPKQQQYGKVSGSARQIVYRGPVLDAEDIVTAILVDDGQADRSRRDALLADKFKHFGIAANVDEKGQFNYCYLLLLSNFEEKQ